MPFTGLDDSEGSADGDRDVTGGGDVTDGDTDVGKGGCDNNAISDSCEGNADEGIFANGGRWNTFADEG